MCSKWTQVGFYTNRRKMSQYFFSFALKVKAYSYCWIKKMKAMYSECSFSFRKRNILFDLDDFFHFIEMFLFLWKELKQKILNESKNETETDSN